MKFLKVFLGILLLLAISGFVYVGVTDVTIEQRSVEKTINNDRFFNQDAGPVKGDGLRP